MKIVNFFQFFSKQNPDFPNFYISTNFLPSFLKTISKFFVLQNFTKNFGILTSVLLCFFTVFPSFFMIDNSSKLHQNVHRATSKKTRSFPKTSLKFFNNLINWFLNISVIFQKCWPSYPQGRTDIYSLFIEIFCNFENF